MNDITDFNDIKHRIKAASATFQKGLYHLFMLTKKEKNDLFELILRTYQCLFLLRETELLLNTKFDFNRYKNRKDYLKEECQNPNQLTRKEIDLVSLLDHSILRNKVNFPLHNHPLEKVDYNTLDLYRKIIDIRHYVLYRPSMLDDLWNDCELIDLLKQFPRITKIEQIYKDFIKAMLDWHKIEQNKPKRTISKEDVHKGRYNPFLNCISGIFLSSLFRVYEDISKNNRPTETLLLSYARMLTPDNLEILRELIDYRNQLLDVENLKEITGINFVEEWEVVQV